MLELAANYADAQPVRIKAIADAQGIPQRFLVQILLQLKTAGLVASVRGASGGYQLAKPPESISLAAVINAIDDRTLAPAASAPGRSSTARRPSKPCSPSGRRSRPRSSACSKTHPRRTDSPRPADQRPVVPDLESGVSGRDTTSSATLTYPDPLKRRPEWPT